MAGFDSLGLKKNIIDVLSKLNYKEPTLVQEKIMPVLVAGGNTVFTSNTGSGKTLAYSAPFLGKINSKFGVQMLVLVPTRELCVQIGKELTKICDRLDISVGVIFGGREIKGDYKTLNKKNQIIVGTPGRLIQNINDKAVIVGDCKYIVFDESDQMFDDGFYKDCAYVLKRVSKTAQIVLASATISDKVRNFMDFEIGNYKLFKIGEEIPKSIVQEKIYCEKDEKNKILLNTLKKHKFNRTMIFCNTKIKVDLISSFLTENKIKASFISGDMIQDNRTNTLNLFREGKIHTLVTTDVTARGLHIKTVDAVINYDVPTKAEFYVHRIGRTGRTGEKGYSLTLICPQDEDRFADIETTYELDVKEIINESEILF